MPCPCSGHLSEAELKDNRVIYRREEISRQHTTKGGTGSPPSAFSQIYSELKVAQKHVSVLSSSDKKGINRNLNLHKKQM